MVRFLVSSTFTASPFTILISHTFFRSLACRHIGIAPLITSIADLDTVLYADATLSAEVRYTNDKILNLLPTLNESVQISLP